jgi:hypothetical protein
MSHFYHLITGRAAPYNVATDADFCPYMYPFWDAETPHTNLVVYNKFATKLYCKPVENNHGNLKCFAENGEALLLVTTNLHHVHIIYPQEIEFDFVDWN